MADILQVNWRYAVNKSQKHDDAHEEVDQGKYKLRAQNMKKRVENEDRLGRKRGARNKGGGPSKMSKYRRKTANARERMRMGEINVAYDRLKDTIPLPSASAGKQKCEKLTKINLLHIAINYIRTLQDILDTGDADIDIVPEKLILNPFHEKTRRESGCSSTHSSPAEDSITNDDMNEDIEDEEEDDDDDMDKSDSPDSGIQEDSDIECPDWTELNSTLDIRSQIVESVNNFKENKVVSVKESSMNMGIFKKQSMLPNSTSNNTNFKFHNFITNADNKVTKCKPVTLTTRSSRSPNIVADRRKKADIKFPLADIKKPLADISQMADIAKIAAIKQFAEGSKIADIGFPCADNKPIADRHNIADIKHPLPLSQIFKPLVMSDPFSSAQLSACQLPNSMSPPSFQMEQDELFNELNNSIDSFDGINDIDFCYDDPFKVF